MSFVIKDKYIHDPLRPVGQGYTLDIHLGLKRVD